MNKWGALLVDGLLGLFDGAEDPAKGKVLIHEVAGVNMDSGIYATINIVSAMSETAMTSGNLGKGDIHTLQPISATTPTNVSAQGMPFYFRDLRDRAWVTFRAYLSGITENISPSWEPKNYVGRSEPVYSYQNTERDISFNLKIAYCLGNK